MATKRPAQRDHDLDGRLRAIAGLPAAVRKRVLVAVACPIPPPAPKWVVDMAEAEGQAGADARALMKVVRTDARRIEQKIVHFADKHVEEYDRFPHLARIGDLLSQIHVSAISQIVEAPRRRMGHPKEQANRTLVFRVAEIFSAAHLDPNGYKDSLFGKVVAQVIFPRGSGDPSRYLRPYSRWRG